MPRQSKSSSSRRKSSLSKSRTGLKSRSVKGGRSVSRSKLSRAGRKGAIVRRRKAA